MSPSAPPADSGVGRKPRQRRWLIPAALLALTPKCIACVLGYASLGAMLGLGGPELCGATGGASVHWETWLLLLGAAGGIGRFTVRSLRAPCRDAKLSAHRR